MANRTLNFEAGNGNWWRRCNHKRKVLIGSEHTFHWLHWHTSCSFSGKNGWKLWGNYAILVSLITDSGENSWCPWLYFLRAYHLDNLCSSKSDVRLRFWSWYHLKKLLWPSWTAIVYFIGITEYMVYLHHCHVFYGGHPPYENFQK